MACTQIPDLPLDQFSREQVQYWLDNHVPLSGSIELDLRCNLRCLHCYRDGEWPSGIMDTDELTKAQGVFLGAMQIVDGIEAVEAAREAAAAAARAVELEEQRLRELEEAAALQAEEAGD